MLKLRQNRLPLVAGAGLCILLIVAVLATKSGYWSGQATSNGQSQLKNSKLAVLSLVSLSPAQRLGQLQVIAQSTQFPDRVRARFLLASDLIQQKQGEKALSWLAGLEQEYPVLAPYIALRRAQADELTKSTQLLSSHGRRPLTKSTQVPNGTGDKRANRIRPLVALLEVTSSPQAALHSALLSSHGRRPLTGDTNKALSAWKDLLKRYPKEPVAAQALFVLGRTKPQYWQQAIAQFPSHPNTLEIARYLLKSNPHQPKLLLLLAHAYDQPGIISVLDQLVSQSRGGVPPLGRTGVSQAVTQLTSADWEVIGFAYWQNQVYAKAGTAYAQAPKTPLNLYRTARGLQLGKKRSEAIAAYQQLVRDFPNAKETGVGLMHLAKMSQTNDALTDLNQVISRFPHQAGAALVEKAKILEALHSQTATEALQLLLSKYSDSDAAAEYRWKVAQARAVARDYQGACIWAQPIPQHNPNSILAPRAGFWLGKWENQLGRQREAQAAFEYVLTKFPQSYYAWRSATTLGLDVGRFASLGQLTPQVVVPKERPLLPAGSATLKELYQLGQDSDAWNLWQVEFQNRMQPTVAEQFIDGLMRLMVGENLMGISQVATLEDRDTPEAQAQYRALRQQSTYWQALYPFPFFQEIETWSQQRQLNPLLVTALIRQESGFEPEVRSIADAIGLMQLIPPTAKWVAAKTHLKQYNLANPSDNVQLGTWFLDYTLQKYNNNSMLAVASYNAGTENVSSWLRRIGKSNPDEFVEAIPFDETRNYVRQVFGNYWNYLRLYNPKVSQLMANYSTASPR